MEELTITIPFSEFLEYLLESADKAKVKRSYHAALLLVCDSDEKYIHIEFPSEDNSLEIPMVWRIRDWKDSSKRLAGLREISEIERQWKFKRDEMLEELAKNIHEIFGVDMNWCQEKAAKIYHENDTKADKVFGYNKLLDVINTKPESLKGKLEIRIK